MGRIREARDFQSPLHLLGHPALHPWSHFSHSLSVEAIYKGKTAMCIVYLCYFDSAFN